MCETETSSATTAPLTPNKRVNYNQGMVLGVDDFRQEQTHLEWQDHLANRLLHGHGTVCGLHVSERPSPSSGDIEILIKQGYALSPHGRWIWVEQDQCAYLRQWLQTHAQDNPAFVGPGTFSVYVKLCYVECPTDQVPIAGQACAPEEENMAASRTLETFHAELSWTAPEQDSETYFRSLGALLNRIVIIGEDSSPLEPDETDLLLDLVRHLPDVSPPDDDSLIYLHDSTACETMRQVLAVWVTEVCPRFAPSDEEDCILLACVEFDVDEGGGVLPATITVDNCERPLLIPSRLQQELFCLMGGNIDHGNLEGLEDDDHPQYLLTDGSRPLAGSWSVDGNTITDLPPGSNNGDAIPYEQAVKNGDSAGGDLGRTYPNPRVIRLQGRSVANIPPRQRIEDGAALTWDARERHWEPRVHEHSLDDLSDVASSELGNEDEGQVLTWNGEEWEPGAPPEGVTDHNELNGLNADDHPQYLRTDGSRPLAGSWSADGNAITDLPSGNSVGDAIPYEQAVKNGDVAGGDLGGTYPNPQVIGLQGRDVIPSLDEAIVDSSVLTWNQRASRWEPRLPEGGGVSGNFVQAPAGEYAIVAAGFFNPDGSPVTGHPPYNDLEAVQVGEGKYVLTFPLYEELIARGEDISIIVKGTIVDPTLPGQEDDPENPEIRADMPASFQVINLNSEDLDGRLGILCWITQPTLLFGRLLRYMQQQEIPDEFNVLHFMATNRWFMVEISAYGPLNIEDTPQIERININTATETELRTLPRIGPALSRRIIETREARGEFANVAELREVSGLDDFMVTRLAHLVTV